MKKNKKKMLDTNDYHNPNNPINDIEVFEEEVQVRDTWDLLAEIETKVEHLVDYFSTTENAYVSGKLNEIIKLLR